MSLREHIARLEGKLDLILERITTMSATTEPTQQAIADLTTLEQKQAADLATLKGAVLTFVSGVTAGGPLTTDQQAAVDAPKTAMGADDATITGITASLTPAASAAPAA